MATTTVLSKTVMTELEVVNMMLSVVDVAPVTSITGAIDLEVELAVNRFSDINRTVQGMGWHFNTRKEVQYLRNVSNQVSIGSNVLRITPVSTSFSKDYVLREGKLYDRGEDSFTLLEDPILEIVELINFEDLPQSARNYIAKACVLEHHATEGADDQKAAITQKNLTDAWATLINDQADLAQETIENNVNVYSTIFGRE